MRFAKAIKLKPEQSLQITVWDWFCKQYPEQASYSYANFNTAKMSYLHAEIHKKMGRKAGIPDLFIGYPRGLWHGMYLELKVDKNKPTPLQTDFMNHYGRFYYCCWANTFESAQNKIKGYLG